MPQLLVLSLFSSWFSFINWLSDPFRSNHPSFPYHLDHPDVTFDMPDEIKEISGLSLTADGEMLAAVNDEAGIVFLLDKKTGEIRSRVPFRESGDFEGVEIVGNDAWVLKSSGTLYQIKNFAEQNPVVEKYKSFLTSENDVEGLAFDAKNNRLLLACKGKGVDGDAPNRAVFAFDLATKMVGESPAFLITLPSLQSFLENSGEEDAGKKKEKLLSGDDSSLSIAPSGIAVHPLSGDVFITSARGNMLLVLDQTGKLLHFEKLKKSTHAQPEGICFDADGTLFIANEGAGGTAKIHCFDYKKQ